MHTHIMARWICAREITKSKPGIWICVSFFRARGSQTGSSQGRGGVHGEDEVL